MKTIAIMLAIAGLTLAACSSGATKTVAGPTTTATITQSETETATVTATPTVIKTIATKVLTHVVTYTPPVKVAFGDGTFRVGSEIRPGTYHTDGQGDGEGCYWEKDGKGIDNILANDNITGPTTIDIESSVYAFNSSGGCDWSRVRS
jgi:hypothetical protein